MSMMKTTKDILDKALDKSRKYGLNPRQAMDEAFSDELGFGSTDMLTMSVLEELHNLGLMLHHTIKR